jgi:hypothetical protein
LKHPLFVVESNNEAQKLLEAAYKVLLKINEGETMLEDTLNSDVFSKLQSDFQNWTDSMIQYRTSKLWIIYMHMVGILRSFIRSVRTGCWNLYLQALHEMLPYLAASGHNNYVKSLVLYLQKMDKLEETHPYVYSKFLEGLFVIRQTKQLLGWNFQ